MHWCDSGGQKIVRLWLQALRLPVLVLAFPMVRKMSRGLILKPKWAPEEAQSLHQFASWAGNWTQTLPGMRKTHLPNWPRRHAPVIFIISSKASSFCTLVRILLLDDVHIWSHRVRHATATTPVTTKSKEISTLFYKPASGRPPPHHHTFWCLDPSLVSQPALFSFHPIPLASAPLFFCAARDLCRRDARTERWRTG